METALIVVVIRASLNCPFSYAFAYLFASLPVPSRPVSRAVLSRAMPLRTKPMTPPACRAGPGRRFGGFRCTQRGGKG